MGRIKKEQDKYKILIVDDDLSIVNIIKSELLEYGYEVDSASNGVDAISKSQNYCPDLIIMDVMMPGCNGIVATVKIRENSNVPILMLSAKAEGTDRVIGLEAGADDYLVKPFMKQELIARVKALLRRYDNLGSIREANTESMLAIGDIELDTLSKKLIVRGDEVHLTATEYKILEYLMQNAGIVLSAEQIYENVWKSDAYAIENTIMIHISRIREKIEINPKRPEYIQVVWGIGYVFKK